MFEQTHRYIVIAVVVLVLIGIIGGAYVFVNGNRGTLRIDGLTTDSQVIIDQKNIGIGVDESGVITIPHLATGSHTVLIARKDAYPWQKTVTIAKDATTTIHPFMVSTFIERDLIGEEDPEHDALKTRIQGQSLPTEARPKKSQDGKAVLWVEDNAIRVTWTGDETERPSYFCAEGRCANDYLLEVGQNSVRNVEFYKNRNDVILIAGGKTVGALELDATPVQNFQTVFTGESPRFIASPDLTAIYVFDNDSLFSIAL